MAFSSLWWLPLVCSFFQARIVRAGSSCTGASTLTVPSNQANLVVGSAATNFASAACDIEAGSTSVWYEFTPSSNRLVTATVTEQSSSTGLAVLESGGGCEDSSLTCIGEYGYFRFSDLEVEWAASAGSTYYLVVTSTPGTNFNLQVESPQVANDDCGSAETLASGAPLSFSATNSAAFPLFSNAICNVGEMDRGLWYKVSSEQDAIGSLELSNQDFRARVSLYDGNTCQTLNCLASTTASTFSDRFLSWQVEAGATYYVLVSGDGFDQHGTFQLDVQASAAASGTCDGATEVATNPYSTLETTFFAVPNFSNVACGIDQGTRGLWYRMTTAEDAIVTALVVEQDFSTILSLYTGTCVELTCVSATSASQYSDRRISWQATAGVQYFVFVSGSDFEESGSYQLSMEILEAPDNQYCTGATQVATPFSVVESNSNAVAAFSDQACGVDANARGLWYRVRPTSDAIATATVTDQTFSTVLSLYNGADCDSLTCSVGTTASQYSDRQVYWAASSGRDYFVHVSGDTFSDDGNFNLAIDTPEPPANGYCDGATELTEANMPFSSFDSNAAAFPAFEDLACSIDNDNRGLWYKFVPAMDTNVRAILSDQDFEGRVSLYKGSCGSLECLVATTASQYSDRSIVWAASRGVPYFIFVSGSEFGEGGNYQIDIETLERPFNDMCQNSTTPGTLPFTIFESNEGSFPGFSDGLCEVADDARNLWYSYESPDDRILRATVEDQDFSARLSLFSGDCSISLSCRSSTSALQYSDRRIDFTAAQGVTNYAVVSGEDFNEFGGLRFSLEEIPRPADDICSSATLVNTGAFNSFDNNEGAYPSFSNPQCEVGTSARGRWYEVDAPSSAVYRATIENQDFSAYISVFAGACDSLACLGSDGPYQYITVGLVFPAYVGSPRHLMVHGDGFEAGNYLLNIQSLPRPANDRCNGAKTLSPSGGSSFDSNTAALPTFENVPCGVDSDSRTLWFSFIPSETAVYTATVSDYEWEAALAIFSGSCDSLSCVSREDYCFVVLPIAPFISYCSFNLSFRGVAGTTYYLAVSGGTGGFSPDGFFNLSVEKTGSASDPLPTRAPTTPAASPSPGQPGGSAEPPSQGAVIDSGGAAMSVAVVALVVGSCFLSVLH